MARKKLLTKILALLGSVLIWLPLLVPLVLGLMRLIRAGRFLFDYLLPAEVFPVPLLGGLLLLGAALWMRARRALIGWGLAASVALLLAGMGFASVTGLASGETEAGGWQGVLLNAIFILFWMALLVLAFGGAQLVRDAFKEQSI